MNNDRKKALIEILKYDKKFIDDGYTDTIHIVMGIETAEELIHLLERSDNSDFTSTQKSCTGNNND